MEIIIKYGTPFLDLNYEKFHVQYCWAIGVLADDVESR